MEAKKMARKIEEHFFTKRNRVNLNFINVNLIGFVITWIFKDK